MKRLSISIMACLLFLVIIMQSVFAGEIFNGEVKDNVKFTVNDIEHIARYYPSAEKASILAGTERVLVPLEDCATLNNLQYCLDSVEEAFDEETNDPMSTMNIRVLMRGPDIDVDRTVSDTKPDLNSEVEVTATIENTGNERASNINYEDIFPWGVKVSSVAYNSAKNGVLWVGSLNPGESDTVKYRLTFQDFLKFDSTAEASWIYNNKVNKVKSGTVTFDVQKPFNITESISSKSVSIGDEIIYTMNISNTASDSELEIKSFEAVIPKGTVISKRDLYLDNVNGKVTYSGTVTEGSSKSLSFRFKSSSVAQGTLVIDLELRMGVKTFTEQYSHKIGIGVSDILPEITFKPSEVKGGKEVEVEAKITNYGENNISDISLNLISDLIEAKGWRHLELQPGKKFVAFNKIINAPSIDEDTDYYVNLSGSYTTTSGKTMVFSAREDLTVLAQEPVVKLSPDVKVSGDSVNITLKVKNIAPFKLTYVSLIDTIPQGFKMTAGSRDIDIDELAIGAERTAYSYVVSVPDTYTKSSFEITHVFNGLDKNEEKIYMEKRTKVNVSASAAASGDANTTAGDSANQTTNRTGADEATEAAAEDADDEKPGVLTRVWRWFKGLFSKGPEDRFE